MGTKKEKKMIPKTIRMYQSQWDAVVRAAKKRKVSLSEFFREIVGA